MDNEAVYFLSQEGELYHAWLKKGEQAEEHKYIARVKQEGGKYRYFYTWPEYRSYLKTTTSGLAGLFNKGKQAIANTIGVTARAEYKNAESIKNTNERLVNIASQNYDKART